MSKQIQGASISLLVGHIALPSLLSAHSHTLAQTSQKSSSASSVATRRIGLCSTLHQQEHAVGGAGTNTPAHGPAEAAPARRTTVLVRVSGCLCLGASFRVFLVTVFFRVFRAVAAGKSQRLQCDGPRSKSALGPPYVDVRDDPALEYPSPRNSMPMVMK